MVLLFRFYCNKRCGCDECVISRLDDSLRHSRSRINAYRALASPSLIGKTFAIFFRNFFFIEFIVQQHYHQKIQY